MKKTSRRNPEPQPHWICVTAGKCLCSGNDMQCDCQRLTYSHPVVQPPGSVLKTFRVDACERCTAAMVGENEDLASPPTVGHGG